MVGKCMGAGGGAVGARGGEAGKGVEGASVVGAWLGASVVTVIGEWEWMEAAEEAVHGRAAVVAEGVLNGELVALDGGAMVGP